jgi:hypothetical protein
MEVLESIEYYRGQEDLIKDIKERVNYILENSINEDLMFDMVHLLKGLKPTK